MPDAERFAAKREVHLIGHGELADIAKLRFADCIVRMSEAIREHQLVACANSRVERLAIARSIQVCQGLRFDADDSAIAPRPSRSTSEPSMPPVPYTA